MSCSSVRPEMSPSSSAMFAEVCVLRARRDARLDAVGARFGSGRSDTERRIANSSCSRRFVGTSHHRLVLVLSVLNSYRRASPLPRFISGIHPAHLSPRSILMLPRWGIAPPDGFPPALSAPSERPRNFRDASSALEHSCPSLRHACPPPPLPRVRLAEHHLHHSACAITPVRHRRVDVLEVIIGVSRGHAEEVDDRGGTGGDGR